MRSVLFFLTFLYSISSYSLGIKNENEIVVATLDLSPWGMYVNGETQGLFWLPSEDIFRGIDKHPFTIRHHLVPLKRALRGMVDNNDYDFAMFTPGPHSLKLIDMGIVLTQIKLILIVRKDIPLKTYQDFKKLRIGVPRGISANTDFIDPTKHKLVNVRDNVDGIKMLKSKRLDAYVETNLSIASNAIDLGLDPKNYHPQFILIEGEVFHAHLWLNKQSVLNQSKYSDYLKKVRESVRRVKDSKKFNQIIKNRLLWLDNIPGKAQKIDDVLSKLK